MAHVLQWSAILLLMVTCVVTKDIARSRIKLAEDTDRYRIKRADDEDVSLDQREDDTKLSRKKRQGGMMSSSSTSSISSTTSSTGTITSTNTITSTTPTHVDVRTITETLKSAVIVGNIELQHDIEENRKFVISGIDSEDSLVHSHQLDMFAEPSAVSGAINKCAYLELLLVQEIHRITQANVDQLLYNSSWQAALKALLGKYCSSPPVPVCDAKSRYRTMDGTCNNLKYPRRGMSFRVQGRLLKPAYQDGIGSPRTKSVLHHELPNPRVVSNRVFKAGPQPVFSADVTSMHVAFGQLIDHDLIFTPGIKGENGTGINCCASIATANRPECLPIFVDQSDPDIKEPCMNFVRSSAAVDDNLRGYRNQLNEVTSYLDASNVYGSNKKKMLELRDTVNKRGLLKMDKYNRLPVGETECFKDSPEDYCQAAGDKRVNVVPNLSALHLLWAREHNRVVKILASHNPTWDDDRLFYEGRKIIIAMMQHVVYNEYLPVILNKAYMKAFKLELRTSGYSYLYQESADATVANVFGAAAFRYGHSQLTNIQAQYSPSHVPTKTVAVETTYHCPHFCEENNGKGYEGVLRWLSNAKAAKTDRFFETGIRNKLFPDKLGRTLDLPAININRGRDHGLPAYNVWREWCRLPKASTFKPGVAGGLVHHSKEAAAALENSYSHTDDIDLYAGAMSETLITEGGIGPTFGCIIGFQFQQLKLGDRYFYENNIGHLGLNSVQLAEIRKVSLSKIICNNIEVIKMQPLAFKTVCSTNARVSCSSLPDVNLEFWKTSY